MLNIFGRRRRRRGPEQRGPGEDGYAAVDALVALTILSSTLIFAIAASHVSRHAAVAALEARAAQGVMVAALERAPEAPGEAHGSASGFAWRATVSEPVLVAGATALCRREAEATALATARRYRLSTAQVCAMGGV